jgi:hypothetical protein
MTMMLPDRMRRPATALRPACWRDRPSLVNEIAGWIASALD